MSTDITPFRSKRDARSVTTRRISFVHDPMISKHFFDDDILMSHLFAILSATFPKGENFFVESVRNVRSVVTDESLRVQIAGFIGQEAAHGREHDRLNGVLAGLGYPTVQVDRATGAVLGAFRALAPESVQLALTAAMEHLTAILAEQLLSDASFEAVEVPSEIRGLFQWHALEECEHKAVAFDTYQDCFGNEAIRVATMNVATALIVLVAVPLLMASVASDRAAWNPARLAKSFAHLRSSPFARRSIVVNLVRYVRPGFHPDERDVDEMLAFWRLKLFGADGDLRERVLQRDR